MPDVRRSPSIAHIARHASPSHRHAHHSDAHFAIAASPLVCLASTPLRAPVARLDSPGSVDTARIAPRFLGASRPSSVAARLSDYPVSRSFASRVGIVDAVKSSRSSLVSRGPERSTAHVRHFTTSRSARPIHRHEARSVTVTRAPAPGGPPVGRLLIGPGLASRLSTLDATLAAAA